MQYYKMVSRYTDSVTGETYLESFNKRYGFTVRYDINEWTYPRDPDHKLFVYDSKSFFYNIYIHYPLEVYKCEVKNPIQIPQHIKSIPVYNNHIKNFWDDINNFQDNIMEFPYYMTIPKDTVWCDAVKIIEEIPVKRSWSTLVIH